MCTVVGNMNIMNGKLDIHFKINGLFPFTTFLTKTKESHNEGWGNKCQNIFVAKRYACQLNVTWSDK